MIDKIIDWALFLAAIAIAAVVVFTHAQKSFGDGGYHVSYNVSNSSGGGFQVAYSSSAKATNPATELPAVTMRTATWCSVCVEAKSKILQSGRFKLVEKFVDDEPVPSFHWSSPTGVMSFSGWHGIEHLTSEYSWTTRFKFPVSAIATRASSGSAITPAQLRSFARSYRGPMTGVKRGNYSAYLLDHGFAAWQIHGLSQQECAKIHGAVHAGYISAAAP